MQNIYTYILHLLRKYEVVGNAKCLAVVQFTSREFHVSSKTSSLKKYLMVFGRLREEKTKISICSLCWFISKEAKKYSAHEFTFVHVCVAILEQSMGVGNPAGIELSYRPSRSPYLQTF